MLAVGRKAACTNVQLTPCPSLSTSSLFSSSIFTSNLFSPAAAEVLLNLTRLRAQAESEAEAGAIQS